MSKLLRKVMKWKCMLKNCLIFKSNENNSSQIISKLTVWNLNITV